MKNSEIAQSWDLWQEYMDTGANDTEERFNSLTVSERIAELEECFGPDDEDEGKAPMNAAKAAAAKAKEVRRQYATKQVEQQMARLHRQIADRVRHELGDGCKLWAVTRAQWYVSEGGHCNDGWQVSIGLPSIPGHPCAVQTRVTLDGAVTAAIASARQTMEDSQT